MYHSFTILGKNTYDRWRLVPEGLQTISLPELKTNFVDVPGSLGVLDLSESLTSYPVYGARNGTLTFRALESNSSWQSRYEDLANTIHGRRGRLVSEDDPNYYYTGRYSVNWTSNNDGTIPTVEINYTLDPYKIYNTVMSLVIDSTESSSWKYLALTNRNEIGLMPVSPKITAIGSAPFSVQIGIRNDDLGLTVSKTLHTLGDGNSIKYPDIILSKQRSSGQILHLGYKGSDCSLRLEFNKGML